MTLSLADLARLRAALEAADYSVDAVVEAIGEEAHRALGRNATTPAVRALRTRRDPLATLTMLWPLQRPVPRSDAEVALTGSVEPLLSAGILGAAGEQIVARVDLRPYASDDGASGWVFADLTPNLDTTSAPIRPDYVLGVSSASSTLAQLTIRDPVGRALDLGTGCGVQTLHLAGHAEQIVATDLNPRAIELARLTLVLNGVSGDLRQGDLYAPVAGERFDLIVTNPPYVISPPTGGARLAYRETTDPGDGLVQRVVAGGVEHLADGGTLQVLANWAHRRGQPWAERLAGWVAPTGCDVHVVQREVLDPYEYAELWLADAGLAGAPDYTRRYEAWLDYFDTLGIDAVGMGWLTLRRAGRSDPQVTIEHWPHPIEQPIGPALGARQRAIDLVSTLSDDQILARRWRLAADLVQQTEGRPGAEDPAHVIIRQQRGFRRALRLDTAQAGILGACDGDLPLGVIVESVAQILAVAPAPLRAETLSAFRSLVVDGLVE